MLEYHARFVGTIGEGRAVCLGALLERDEVVARIERMFPA